MKRVSGHGAPQVRWLLIIAETKHTHTHTEPLRVASDDNQRLGLGYPCHRPVTDPSRYILRAAENV